MAFLVQAARRRRLENPRRPSWRRPLLHRRRHHQAHLLRRSSLHRRLSDRALTDPASIPNDNSEALFQFGAQTRNALKKYIDTLPAADWDAFREFDFFNGVLRATPKKIVTHVLLHEIRHWAQIATLLRLNGLKDELHDFIFTPVLGGEIRRNQPKS